MNKATKAKKEPRTGVGFGELVRLLESWPGIPASVVGSELWGASLPGDSVPARYCRPAGRLLSRAKKAGLVYECLDFDRKRRVFYARQNNKLTDAPTKGPSPALNPLTNHGAM